MKKKFMILILLFSTSLVFANLRLLRINYKKGLNYYKNGNYVKSVVHLLDVLKNTSINNYAVLSSKVYLLLGKSYNLLSDFNNAEYYLFQLFRNTPINRYFKEGLLEIGKTYTLSKKYTKAIQVYNYIEEKFNEPNFVSESIYLKGEVYLLKQDMGEAIEQFKRIVSHYKNTKRYQDARMRLMQLGYLRDSSGENSPPPENSERFNTVKKNKKNVRVENVNESGLTEEERKALELAEKKKRENENQKKKQQIKKNKNKVVKKQDIPEGTGKKIEKKHENTVSEKKITPEKPKLDNEKKRVVIPDISFPSDRTYYPSDSGFARKLRYDLLKGIKNLSERDLRKLESRLRLLEKRERELTRLRKELLAFHKLLLTKDRLLALKKKTLEELSKELKSKQSRLLLLMKLNKNFKNIKNKLENDGE